jgi:hypothetical protein
MATPASRRSRGLSFAPFREPLKRVLRSPAPWKRLSNTSSSDHRSRSRSTINSNSTDFHTTLVTPIDQPTSSVFFASHEETLSSLSGPLVDISSPAPVDGQSPRTSSQGEWERMEASQRQLLAKAMFTLRRDQAYPRSFSSQSSCLAIND